MELSNRYKRVPLDQIVVQRDIRQRREITTVGLKESIGRMGVLVPILIDRSHNLIAGERRLTASRELGLPDIPVRYFNEISAEEMQIVEYEENAKRMDLSWRDSVLATQRVHSLHLGLDPLWNKTKTAEALNIAPSTVSNMLRVAESIDSPKIAKVSSWKEAYNVLSREDDRKIADAVSDIILGVEKLTEPPKGADAGVAETHPAPPDRPDKLFVPKQHPESIITGSFLDWAPTYSGRPFNFIHCDFPYGIKVFSAEQSGANKWDTYDDSPEVYWGLLECLTTNLAKLMAPSAHIMFWLAGDINIQHETLVFLRKKAPELDMQTYPLVWLKSDNAGILPDMRRQPRRVYETAIIGSMGDRPIAKPISNAYAAPTDKTLHHSTKPEPVLKHFFQLFVDESTSMLDPTCGSGSALRAAEALGAKHILGLEKDPGYADSARKALLQHRTLRGIKG